MGSLAKIVKPRRLTFAQRAAVAQKLKANQIYREIEALQSKMAEDDQEIARIGAATDEVILRIKRKLEIA